MILEDVSFSIEPKERVCLVGRNGCGKTTLMQILAGAMKPTGGSLSFFGQNPLKDRRVFGKYCGYVPQELPLLMELTVKDNLKLWKVPSCPNYEYILDRFDLKDIMNIKVSRLSGGMKKRLSIACAIASWPSILLLDEPASALDLYFKDSIDEWLSEYQSLNGMVLISTHEEKEILSSDRALVLKEGRIHEVLKDENMMFNIRELLK